MLDKIKSLSKDTLIYGTSTVIQRFLAFILLPLYTNVFKAGEYGIVSNLFAYIAILNVFFSIGLESGYFKFASSLEAGDKKQNFSHPYFLVFINSLILCSILFFFPVQLAPVFQLEPKHASLLQYSAFILFFDAVVLIPFAYLRLHRRAKIFGTLKVLSISINLALNLILILGFHWGIEAAFLSNAIASGVTFLIFIPLILKNFTFTVNKQLYKELIKFSLPLIPAGIGANFVQTIDRPILLYLTNSDTVGIYQANYRLGILMMLFVSIYEFAWRPFFLQTVKDSPNAKQIFSKIMTLFIFAASVLFLFFSFYIENIAKIPFPFRGYVLGKDYWSGLYIVPIVLAGYLFYGIYINLIVGIYIEKKTKYLAMITGIGAAVNVIANFSLIPKFGITGAAYATLISYFIMMLSIYYVSTKLYKIDYEFSKIYLILFSTAASFAMYYFTAGTFLHEWYLKIIFIIAFFVLIFTFKIVKLSDIKNLKALRK